MWEIDKTATVNPIATNLLLRLKTIRYPNVFINYAGVMAGGELVCGTKHQELPTCKKHLRSSCTVEV